MPDSASVLSDFLKLSAQEQRDVLHGLVASGGDVNQELGQSFFDAQLYANELADAVERGEKTNNH